MLWQRLQCASNKDIVGHSDCARFKGWQKGVGGSNLAKWARYQGVEIHILLFLLTLHTHVRNAFEKRTVTTHTCCCYFWNYSTITRGILGQRSERQPMPPGKGRLVAFQTRSHKTARKSLKHTAALSFILLIQSPSEYWSSLATQRALMSYPWARHFYHHDPWKISRATTARRMSTSSLTHPIISHFLQLISEELLGKDGAITL